MAHRITAHLCTLENIPQAMMNIPYAATYTNSTLFSISQSLLLVMVELDISAWH